MQSVCVYCGSSLGIDANCQVAAMSMGKSLANRNLTMVYGGGRVGLMGIAADAALQAGGEVVGVIPEALGSDEIAHSGLSKLHFVRSMHERKAKMADLSDGFVALPGAWVRSTSYLKSGPGANSSFTISRLVCSTSTVFLIHCSLIWTPRLPKVL